ncbi:putative ankyrin repeat domain-containing protein 20A3 [Perognathus longimembris pacificus]|uniref:putative ankyrin repeat domain-containing protein 20A3 n=1 Tax=Perognathus longimembris pacificus TaxID=214514 RepID=UPI002019A284|nr:putative ankyrin repeat domain-containing protein 20A3 [Perognathus longimembris pacificus]
MRRALRCCWGDAGQPGGADSPRALAHYKAVTKWHRAASVGDAARVRKMLVRGKADVNAADRQDRQESMLGEVGPSRLRVHTARGEAAASERALPGPERPLHPHRTALHFACAYGHPKVVTLLLRSGCEVDAVDSDCNTALMKATQCQQEDCVCILLEHGADPNRRDACGKTALQHAVSVGNIRIAAKLVAFGAYVDNIRKDILLEISNAAKEDEQHMSNTSLKNEEDEGKVDDMENKCRGQEESNEETTASHENVPEEEHTKKLHVKTQLETDMIPPDMELNGSEVNVSEDEALEITTPEKECEHQKTETTLKNEENEGEVDDMENKCRGKEESNEETTASHENVPEEEHTNKLHVKTQLETDMTPPDMELNGSKVNVSEDENVHIQSSKCEQLSKEMGVLKEELRLMRSAYESQTEEFAKLTHKLYREKLQTKRYKEISKVSAASENLQMGKYQQLQEENNFLKEQLQSLQSKNDSLAEENTKLKEDQKHLTESCKCTIAMTEQYRIFLTQKTESEISEQAEKVSNFIQEQNRARAYQDAVWTSTVQAQLSKISQLSNKLQECERKIKRLEDENCKLHLRVHLCQTSSETFTTRNSLNNPTERNSQSFLGPRTHFSAREDYADLSPRLRSAFEKVDAFLRKL